MHVQLLLSWIPPQRPVGACQCLLWDGGPSLFDPQGAFLRMYRQGSFSWPQEWSSLYFSRAQLLPLALSLECLGENKASILLHLTNLSSLVQGSTYLLPHSGSGALYFHSFIYALIHLFIQQTFTEHLPCARICSRSWAFSSEQGRQKYCSNGVHILPWDNKQANRYIDKYRARFQMVVHAIKLEGVGEQWSGDWLFYKVIQKGCLICGRRAESWRG